MPKLVRQVYTSPATGIFAPVFWEMFRKEVLFHDCNTKGGGIPRSQPASGYLSDAPALLPGQAGGTALPPQNGRNPN